MGVVWRCGIKVGLRTGRFIDGSGGGWLLSRSFRTKDLQRWLVSDSAAQQHADADGDDDYGGDAGSQESPRNVIGFTIENEIAE